jgi:hypothetical protein
MPNDPEKCRDKLCCTSVIHFFSFTERKKVNNPPAGGCKGRYHEKPLLVTMPTLCFGRQAKNYSYQNALLCTCTFYIPYILNNGQR